MGESLPTGPLPDYLRDIHGPDAAPWWPPAPGWWGVLALLVLLPILWRLYRWYRAKRLQDWRHDSRYRLRGMIKRLRAGETRQVAVELSELLRRVAMVRFGRHACAGLVGEEWLRWLQQHDPAGFDWSRQGRILLDLPYAPPDVAAGSETATALVPLLRAARHWTVTVPVRKVARAKGREDSRQNVHRRRAAPGQAA